MKIPIRVLPKSEYPVEPGLYLWQWSISADAQLCELLNDGWYDVCDWAGQLGDLPDGIAWSERIECEVIG